MFNVCHAAEVNANRAFGSIERRCQLSDGLRTFGQLSSNGIEQRTRLNSFTSHSLGRVISVPVAEMKALFAPIAGGTRSDEVGWIVAPAIGPCDDVIDLKLNVGGVLPAVLAGEPIAAKNEETEAVETGSISHNASITQMQVDINRVTPEPCRHHWKVASAEDWCDCDGTHHLHAWCRECAAERTFPSYIETGPIAKAAMYAKRGAKAKWKKAETAEAPAEASAPAERRERLVVKLPEFLV